jgi:transketolase
MRKTFGQELFKLMEKDKKVWCLTGNLGFGLFDAHFQAFPERMIDCGASEQAMLGAAVGLSLSNKIVFCYSITPFLIYRPMEWIRNYLDHERIKVILVGSGLDDDYSVDGFSHHAFNMQTIMLQFPNIESYFPKNKKEIPELIRIVYNARHPSFIGLRR